MASTIERIWRYPVKSLGGEQLRAATLDSGGIEGDRRFGIRHLGSGTILTARRRPELLFASARWNDGEVEIVLPDGSTAADDAALSSWLEDDVALVRSDSEAGTFENPMDVENEADWVSWDGPDDTFHDSGRTQVSLVGLDALGDWDERRFRKNLIATGTGEDDLVGYRLAIGSAALDVTKRVERCVMVTRPQPDGIDRDLDVFRTVLRERDGTVGIGLTVHTPGEIRVGDAVQRV